MGKIELSTTSNSDFLKMQRSQLTGDAKWKDIEDLINRWARRNPDKARYLQAYILDVRSGLYDKKFGRSKIDVKKSNHKITDSEGQRIGVVIDPELMNYIQAFYPDFMDSKDDLHEFKKRFPKFKISEAI